MVRKGEIEGRLDTGFYKPETIKFIKWLANKSHTQKLKVFIKSMNTGFNNEQNENKNGLRFLRTQNVRPVYLDFENATFTTDKTVQISKKGTLLFTRIGVNVGDVSFNNIEDFAISDNVICADLQDETLAYYVAIFLSTERGKILLEMQKRDTARPLISYENIRNLLIPVLSIDEQNSVISIFENAYSLKQQKEAEAAALLASIDGYLLQELGITLPPPSEKKTYFLTRSSQVSGNRFDPFYHQTEFELLEQAIINGNYKIEKLGNFLSQINYGASVKNEYEDSGIPFLRITDLKRNEISVKKMMYLPESMRKEIGNSFVYENDFLISRSGTLGVVALVEKEIDSFAYGSFMIKFTLNKNAPINKNYLSYFLNSETMQKIVAKNKIGAIQGNITIPTIRNLQIPLPPLKKQTEIANHISALRTQAKQLQQQAAAELAHAKQHVEHLILGE